MTSKGFKALNRLFIKASSGGNNNNNSGNGSRVGSGLGLGAIQGNGHPHSSGQSTPTSANRSLVAGADTEWRSRIKAKLYQGSNGSSTGINSMTSADTPLVPGSESAVQSQQHHEDAGENPLTTLRGMLKAVRDQEKGEESGKRRMQKALFWLDLMVQSGVQIPAQAFLECCECLINTAGLPCMVSVHKKPLDPASHPTQSSDVPLSRTNEQAQRLAWSCTELLEQSKTYLKSCWEHIVLSTHRISESEVSEILNAVLSANQTMIFKVMSDGPQGENSEDLERYIITPVVSSIPRHLLLLYINH